MGAKTTGFLVIVLLIGVFTYLALYTDQLGPISTYFHDVGTIGAISALIPLSIANTAMKGDLVCDLDVRIPTLINNDALFGTSMVDIITDENGRKLSGDKITGFLSSNEYLYISNENMPSITYSWQNCFNEGSNSLAALIPLFNGQIASERIATLSFQDPTVTTPQLTQPLIATGSQIKPFTIGTILILKIEGTSINNDLRLIDKNGFGEWTRSLVYDDGLAYPVFATLRYTIENVKVDDYQISVSSAEKPINEMRLTEDYNFNICGINQLPLGTLIPVTMC